MAKRLSNLPEGTRVHTLNYKTDEMEDGTIESNLSVMYYINFDSGVSDFIFKHEDFTVLEE